MSPELYSVEQVAALLGLHARTVRNYVRGGRLKAVRIGKQYRIAREDLAAMTGRPAPPTGHGPAKRHVDVSSVVEIDMLTPDAATRLTNGLVGAAKSRGREDESLRVETIYNQERARLKVILNGSVSTVGCVLQLLTAYLEE
jgi:excisionase family DNA binding protein